MAGAVPREHRPRRRRLIIRSKVPESPVFEDVKDSGEIAASPILDSVKKDWRDILRGIGLRVAETAATPSRSPT